MKILVLQHIAVEHPGVWRDFMRADGVAWDKVELDAGEAIPPLAGYDALLSMGGPMDVFEEAEYPWLAAEKAVIREAARERGMPFLGVCLGHQLLADALGGAVGRAVAPEVGLMEVALTPAGRADALFRGLDETIACLQWHGCEIRTPPADCQILAVSGARAIQAIRVGRHAYGLQFHIEMTPRTVAEWAEVPAYERALETALGPGAVARLKADIAARLPAFNATARRLYENFVALSRDTNGH